MKLKYRNIHLILLFISIFILASCSGKKENDFNENYYLNYPSYGQVVKYFFSHYKDIFREGKDLETGQKFYHEWILMKKPDGWFVAQSINSPDSLSIEKEYQLWSAKDQKFIDLQLDKAINPDTNTIYHRFFNEMDLHDFTVHPFFGYKGWADDVIKVFGKQEKLNDTILYGLARAYSVSALARIGIRTDPYSQTNGSFDKIFDPESIPGSERKLALEEAQSSLTCLSKLQKQNASFRTRYGNVDTKLSNDKMLYWLHFTLIGQTELAKQFIDPNAFPETFRNFGKNILNSCSPNAILIVWEDLDTWSALFAQQALGIRKDVIIIPHQLLSLPRFRNYLRNSKTLPGNLAFSLAENFYRDSKNRDIESHSVKAGQESAEMKSILTQLKTGSGSLLSMDSQFGIFITADQLKIKVDPEGPGKKFGKNNLQQEIFTGKRYSYSLADFATLDLISSNDWNKPFEISACSPAMSFFPLAPYLWMKGLTAELKPIKPGINDRFNYMISNVDAVPLENNINEVYNFKMVVPKDQDEKFILFYYKNCFSAEAAFSMASENKANGKKWLDQCLNLFPPDPYYLHSEDFWMVQCAFEAGDKEQCKTLIYSISQGIKDYLSQPGLSQGERKQQSDYFDFLIKMANSLGDGDLAKIVEDSKNKNL